MCVCVYIYVDMYVFVCECMRTQSGQLCAMLRVGSRSAPRANYDERFLHLLALIHLEN